ncbi:MAG: hypothetical protein CSA81_06605 [Acidobacteria bacterium]|nr:MAG: hypothetical protein CSA81_06605 [Acidobacteriota bacterium]
MLKKEAAFLLPFFLGISLKEKTQYKQEQPELYTAPHTLKMVGLSWLIPGLGHWLQGRKKRAVILFSALLLAVFLGAILGGDLYPFSGEGRFRAIGALCQSGLGLFYAVVRLFTDRGNPLNITYDYGTIYYLIAGMINWLAVIDSFDIAVKRK